MTEDFAMTTTPPNDDHHADSLRALAEGQGPDQEPGSEADATDQQTGESELDALEQAEAPSVEYGQGEAIAPAGPKVDRKARASQMRQAQNDQLKKMAVPLLLVVGGLLIVLGSLGTYFAFAADSNDAGVTMEGGPWLKIASLVAFPLALILLAGALLFTIQLRTRPSDPDR
jgi:hypothetical protein